MAEKDGEKSECAVCGRKSSEIVMFVCRNCGSTLCLDCGKKRYFSGKIPILYDMNKGLNVELLTNIGTCYRCGAVMGYESIPFALRMRMLSVIPKFVPFFVNRGLIGGDMAEKIMIDYQVLYIFVDMIKILNELPKFRDNPKKWWDIYIKIKNRPARIEWSTSYVIKEIDPPLNMLGENDKELFGTITKKMILLFEELRLTVLIQRAFITLYKNTRSLNRSY